jgi:hypothetical protein
MWPPEKISVSLSWGEAVLLYELLSRYQESGQPTLTTDRAEWRAFVLLLGQLEQNGAAEVPEYATVLADARRELGSYDGTPF